MLEGKFKEQKGERLKWLTKDDLDTTLEHILRPRVPEPTASSEDLQAFSIQFSRALYCHRTLREAKEVAEKVHTDGVALYEIPEKKWLDDLDFEELTIYRALRISKFERKLAAEAQSRLQFEAKKLLATSSSRGFFPCVGKKRQRGTGASKAGGRTRPCIHFFFPYRAFFCLYSLNFGGVQLRKSESPPLHTYIPIALRFPIHVPLPFLVLRPWPPIQLVADVLKSRITENGFSIHYYVNKILTCPHPSSS